MKTIKETDKAWIARDKNGDLFMYDGRPRKMQLAWTGVYAMSFRIDSSLFPQIKWEDKEPTEVELTIKVCK